MYFVFTGYFFYIMIHFREQSKREQSVYFVYPQIILNILKNQICVIKLLSVYVTLSS